MRFYSRLITERGTVMVFNDEWHAEDIGSLLRLRVEYGSLHGFQVGDQVFVGIEHSGATPRLYRTNDKKNHYNNEICKLERVE